MTHALAILGLSVLGAVLPRDDAPRVVTVREHEGAFLATVHARRADVGELARELASKCGRTIEGLEHAAGADPVDVDLEDRSIDQVLRILLGCAGLRPETHGELVRVVRDVDDTTTPRTLDELTESAYSAATRAFPRADGIAAAELALARILERRGETGAALARYDALATRHARSEQAFEALGRAGAILAARGEWTEAARRFTQLANAPEEHGHHATARRELARALAWSGRGPRAISILDVLDGHFATLDKAEIADRRVIRALALADSSRAAETLALLDLVSRTQPERIVAVDARRARALALERLDRKSEAARAWLALASSTDDGLRAEPLARAARLALGDGDLVGAIVASRGIDSGSGTLLAAAARRALGLDADPDDVEARSKSAEEECALGAYDRASAIVEPLWSARQSLGDESFARVALVVARCVDHERGAGPAVDVVCAALDRVEDAGARRRLHLAAADIHVRHGDIERAISAFEGRHARTTDSKGTRPFEAPNYCADPVGQGIASVRAGLTTRGLELLNRVPSDPLARFWSGRAWLRLGRVDEARASFGSAAELATEPWLRARARAEIALLGDPNVPGPALEGRKP